MRKNILHKLITGLLCAALLFVIPFEVFAIGNPPSQAGKKVISGGQRDFAFPVPGCLALSSCFLDNRSHYALDFAADKGTAVVASYNGTVIATHDGCTHNYGKTKSCGCGGGFGNYVILQHDYVLKGGEHITLYSSYNHLTKVSVSEGQTVTKGQKVGTIGSTGYSTGFHLDYQILYGGWAPFRSYSIDPYINELLELPSGLYSLSSGGCCSKYVAYVKEYYPHCQHETFNASGSCTGCGFIFDFSATRNTEVMGVYTVNSGITPATYPYTASLGSSGQAIAADAEVSVSAILTNGAGESWYQLQDGNYLPKSALTFARYFPSEFQCQITSPAEEQTLKQESQTLSGSIQSLYPLRKVSGYLDGTYYGGWSGTGNATALRLSATDINGKLYFSTLAPGKHTLTITATDLTGREETTVLERIFYIEQPPVFHTITLDPMEGSCESSEISVQEGFSIGALPTPEKEDHIFSGWYLESGEAVTEETVITQSLTLYAHWIPINLTVSFGDIQVPATYGQCIETLPEVTQEGFVFLGWYTAEEGGIQFTPQTPVLEALVLYARWEGFSYDVTLDPGDGKVTWHTKTVTMGKNYGRFPVPTLDGYRFIGWNLEGKLVTNTTPVMTARNHTLTAIWEPIGTIPPATQVSTAEIPGSLLANFTLESIPLWVPLAGFALLAAAAVVFVLHRRKQETDAVEEAPAQPNIPEPEAEEEPKIEEIIAEAYTFEDDATEQPLPEIPSEETESVPQ